MREVKRGSASPKLQITNVESGFTDEEILVALYEERMRNEMTYDECMKGARVLFRRPPCKRERAENVVVELKAETFRRLIGRERVTVGMIGYFVEEFFYLAVCYRCSRFDHTGGRCVEGKCCNKCGGSREVRDCEEKVEWGCPSCKRVGISKRDRCHRASDKRCFVYRKKNGN